jgi:RimJ/RimL family protein N-acetyltransferase
MNHQSPVKPAADHAARPPFRWLPIRSLAPRHRPRILDHLLTLSERDRYLRFGHPASDAQIGRYVDLIDFERDEVFGVFNRRVEVIAMAHLAYIARAGQATSAEFGVSVGASVRGRGFGARLFDHAVLHARNRDVDTLLIHALTENTAMLRIARSAGAVIERDGSDAQALLKLPPMDLSSRLEALLSSHAAEIDYGLKVNARRVDRVLEVVAELRSGMSSAGRGSNV